MPNENDKIVQCPYEKAHLILKGRFQVHLGRCRRNHPNVEKVVCPFNVTHIINKPECDWHVKSCPDRGSFDNYRHRDELATRAAIVPPQAFVEEIICSENWDDQPDVETYNPQKHALNAPVIRIKQGVTPSEKKQFRKDERARVLALDN